jgi:hypothetical protein
VKTPLSNDLRVAVATTSMPDTGSGFHSHATPRPRVRRKGSVLVIVMITLLFAAFALVTFMEKASVDLLVDQRDVLNRRLRMEAYSALEMTLGVLNEFREAGNGLHSPAEGWSDPLTFVGYTPSEGRVVEIAFDDESGKISLPRVTPLILTNLFKNWGILQADAEGLADAMLGWMKRNHVYTSSVQPNYETGVIPYVAPGRSLRSFHELAAIEKVRETFYDADGRPNELWRRFADTVSLLDFARPNINGAKADTLAALGQFDQNQQQNIGEFLKGSGAYQAHGPQFFQSPNGRNSNSRRSLLLRTGLLRCKRLQPRPGPRRQLRQPNLPRNSKTGQMRGRRRSVRVQTPPLRNKTPPRRPASVIHFLCWRFTKTMTSLRLPPPRPPNSTLSSCGGQSVRT